MSRRRAIERSWMRTLGALRAHRGSGPLLPLTKTVPARCTFARKNEQPRRVVKLITCNAPGLSVDRTAFYRVEGLLFFVATASQRDQAKADEQHAPQWSPAAC